MKWQRRKTLDRERSMAGRPQRVPIVRQQEQANGDLRVTVRGTRPRWLRWWTGNGEVDVSFDLDYLGREVYEACAGKADVKSITRRFAKAHNLSAPEAELSVTTFLKTLMAKGLVTMVVDREKKAAKE